MHGQQADLDAGKGEAVDPVELVAKVAAVGKCRWVAVTSTAVAATHRRQSLLRQMMQAMFDEACERGSRWPGSARARAPFTAVTARPGNPAHSVGDRAHRGPVLSPRVPGGSLEITGAETTKDAWRVVHDAARISRVGELSAPPDRWSDLDDASTGTAGPRRYLVHRDPVGSIDGVANYRLPWSPRIEEAGMLVVEGLPALNDDAYRSMWELLLDFDLTRKVIAAPRPSDEPLR